MRALTPLTYGGVTPNLSMARIFPRSFACFPVQSTGVRISGTWSPKRSPV